MSTPAPAVPFVEAGDVTYGDSSLPLRSRVHPLRLTDDCAVSIKRDDELSFGASGSKVRKYASLVPHLVKRGVTHAVVVGAMNSNNVLAAAQFLPERGIRPLMVLRAPREHDFPSTVFDLIRQLVPDSDITVLPRRGWEEASLAAQQMLAGEIRRAGGVPEVLPEGASHSAALAGASTLAIDLTRNEGESGQQFRDVFIEAGSGMSAQAFAIRRHLHDPGCRVHVLCTAITPERFRAAHLDLLRRHGLAATLADRLRLHPAPGTHTLAGWKSVWEPVRSVARRNGILFDPYYSGRLLALLRDSLEQGRSDPDRTLMIHTGGGIGLLPYLEDDRHPAARRAEASRCFR